MLLDRFAHQGLGNGDPVYIGIVKKTGKNSQQVDASYRDDQRYAHSPMQQRPPLNELYPCVLKGFEDHIDNFLESVSVDKG